MVHKSRLGAIALAFACTCPHSPSFAQTKSASAPVAVVVVDGTLRNSSGKPMGGVALELRTADGQVVAKATTDRGGGFRFDGVPAGNYVVSSGTVTFNEARRSITVPAAGVPDLALVATATADLGSVQVIAARLNEARQQLSPDIGADVYKFDRQDIVDLPGGPATPLNDVLLQASGVTQDSYGQLHVRGDHANLQYRLNGIIIPESIAGFGQTISTRFVDQLSLITGALPAQYGYRTAGVVDITTKGGALDEGVNAGYYGGSHSTNNVFADAGGAAGNLHLLRHRLVDGQQSRNRGADERPEPDPRPYDAGERLRLFFLRASTRTPA